MIGEAEISRLRDGRDSLRKKIERIGLEQCQEILRLYKLLKELMAGIEETKEREKSLYNPAIITRMRIAKKGYELGKGLNHFEIEVAAAFEKGIIKEDAGRRFIRIAKLIKEKKMDEAKGESSHFESITGLMKAYEGSKEEIEGADKLLRREELRIGKVLQDMSDLEKEAVDLERAQRYERLLIEIERLKKARESYIHSLLSTPVSELLPMMENQRLGGFFPSFPSEDGIAGLKAFFSDYPAFGKCNAEQLCEFFGYSEKRLSHVCPETSRFRKAVGGNRAFFEAIRSLQQTAILPADGEDESVLDFFARNAEGAQEIVESIRALGKDKGACRHEYDKRARVEGKRKELSDFSRTEMEAELGRIRHLLELLHSEKRDDGNRGLLSILDAFLKR
jgi:hypothetical protein